MDYDITDRRIVQGDDLEARVRKIFPIAMILREELMAQHALRHFRAERRKILSRRARGAKQREAKGFVRPGLGPQMQAPASEVDCARVGGGHVGLGREVQ